MASPVSPKLFSPLSAEEEWVMGLFKVEKARYLYPRGWSGKGRQSLMFCCVWLPGVPDMWQALSGLEAQKLGFHVEVAAVPG